MTTSTSGGGDESNSEPIVDGEIAAEELQDNFRYACWVALVPGLPRFYLLFVFHNNTWNRKIGKALTGKAWEHPSHDVRWVRGGRGGGPTAKTMHRTICSSTLSHFSDSRP